MSSGVPVIAADGQPATHDDVGFWMVLDNSCDFARERSQVRWTQMVPIVQFDTLRPQNILDLQGYRLSRRFYLPPWPSAPEGRHFVADLLRPVAIDKDAFNGPAEVLAGLELHAWLLLHCCVVRFLTRDDGRFDE